MNSLPYWIPRLVGFRAMAIYGNIYHMHKGKADLAGIGGYFSRGGRDFPGLSLVLASSEVVSVAGIVKIRLGNTAL